MDDEEELNKKDITSLITGKCIDFDENGDEIEEEEEYQDNGELEPGQLHPLVGVMDMLISTSQEPLKKHGYPEPNLSIWEEWGKPNLSKAFMQYMPMNSAAGQAINSPAFAGLIGVGALGIAFLPVIMHYMEKRKEKKEAEEAAKEEKREDVKPAAKVTYPVVEEEPESPKDVKRIQTADRAAPPKVIKLPGGGDDAAPPIPMMELIARNMASGNVQPI